MRRFLIAAFASLLALALIAPTAHGATKVRHLIMDAELGGGPPGPQQGIALLKIDYLVKHKHGHKKLIPQRVTDFPFLFVPVSCDQGAGIADLETSGFGGVPGIEITKKRFSYKYTGTAYGGSIQFTVQFAGQKMWQDRTKWRDPRPNPNPPGKKFVWKRASGTLNIIDYDWSAAGETNCTTNGPRSWSAHQCEGAGDPAYLPSCNRSF